MSDQKESLFAKPLVHLAVYALGVAAIFIGHRIEPTNLAGPGLDFFALVALGLVAIFFFGYFLLSMLPLDHYPRSSKIAILAAHGAGIFAVIWLGAIL